MCSISLCMIVKNEEKNIERCLNSAKKPVDEIVIVGTGFLFLVFIIYTTGKSDYYKV